MLRWVENNFQRKEKFVTNTLPAVGLLQWKLFTQVCKESLIPTFFLLKVTRKTFSTCTFLSLFVTKLCTQAALLKFEIVHSRYTGWNKIVFRGRYLPPSNLPFQGPNNLISCDIFCNFLKNIIITFGYVGRR